MPDEYDLERLHDRIDAVCDNVNKQSAEASSLSTLVRQHIGEQRAINAKLDQLVDGHEARLRELELWRADRDARMPGRLLHADVIEQHLQQQDGRIDEIQKTLTRWVGIAVGAMVAAQTLLQFVIVPAMRMAWQWATGSGG